MLSKLALVKDKKVRSGGFLFAIRSNGDITGHKQQKGYKIPQFENDLKSSIVFITCPNQQVVGKHSIGFCSFHQKFVDMKDGALEDISMILVKGMVHEDGVVKVVFHRWTGQINNLQDEISRYKYNARGFIQEFFNPVPEAVCIDEIDIHYVNQILGSRLNEWNQEKSVYLHEDGHYYYKAKMQPDSFCKRDPFPDSKRYEFLKPPRNRVKIGDTTFQTANDETGKYIGDPALRLHNNSTTQVIYSLRHNNTSSLGNFNKPIVIGKDKYGKDKEKIFKPLLQTMPTLPGDSNSTVTLVPISKEDRTLLAKKCIAEGGLSSETFISEMMKYTNKYGAEPIEVHKIGLNKVRTSLSFQCHIQSYVYNITL